MVNPYIPVIGNWYQSRRDIFEIVALDEAARLLEIQYFDGDIEEIDYDAWQELEVISIEQPEDWSGSLDLEKEDYGVDLELNAPNDNINPLDELE